MSEETSTNPSGSSAPATRAKGSNIIAVASGKGGVGKTWFSITLAHAIARSGRKVLLFDGDLGLANLDIQLGLMTKKDLGAVLAGRASLSQAVTFYEEAGSISSPGVRAQAHWPIWRPTVCRPYWMNSR